MYSNNISVIKTELFQKNVNLVRLNLNGNKLNFVDEEHAAGVFENLKSLQELSLRYNQISELPAFKGLVGLVTLDVSYNKLTRPRASSYEVLKNLKYLKMTGNQILLEASFLKFSKSLRSMALDNNQITKIEHSAFSELDNLGTLNLSHNNLTQLESKSFKGLTSLFDLDLSFNKIEKIDRKIFDNFKLLLKLDMRENRCANDSSLWINNEKIDNLLSQCFSSSNVLKSSLVVLLVLSLILIGFQ